MKPLLAKLMGWDSARQKRQTVVFGWIFVLVLALVYCTLAYRENGPQYSHEEYQAWMEKLNLSLQGATPWGTTPPRAFWHGLVVDVELHYKGWFTKEDARALAAGIREAYMQDFPNDTCMSIFIYDADTWEVLHSQTYFLDLYRRAQP